MMNGVTQKKGCVPLGTQIFPLYLDRALQPLGIASAFHDPYMQPNFMMERGEELLSLASTGYYEPLPHLHSNNP